MTSSERLEEMEGSVLSPGSWVRRAGDRTKIDTATNEWSGLLAMSKREL